MKRFDATRTKGRGGWLLLVITALGCGTNDAIIRDDYAGAGGASGSGGSGGSGGAPSSATGQLCAGRCAPLGPAEWLGPALVWVGKPGEAPACPDSAPVSGDLGFSDLSAPTVCGACACDPPSGSCALPTTLTASSTICPGDAPGAAHTVFDAPAGWSGACTPGNPIALNQKCNGVSCVQSLTIAPLTLTEAPCGVRASPAPSAPPPTWGAAARSCHGLAAGACASPSEVCAPPAEPGFQSCVIRDGDRDCPAPYTEKHVFFAGLTDTRSCSPCGCGAPIGSTCTALVSAYKDSDCGAPVASVTVDATGPACLDILPAGQALGSKLAEEPSYAPGACEAGGGAPSGEAAPTGPTTVCCSP